MRLPDPHRISHRAIPVDADAHVSRCVCGAWAWDRAACTSCALLAAQRLAARLQVAA